MRKHFVQRTLAFILVLAMVLGGSAGTVSADETGEAVEAPAEETSDGLLEMPEDYVMSDMQEEIKENTVKNDIVNILDTLTPGEDYIEDEIVCMANSREEAEAIAEAYGGVLASFAYGVGVISLKKSVLSVEEAVRAGADPNNDVPAVQPGYIVKLEEPAADDKSQSRPVYGSVSSFPAPSPTTWEDIRDPEGEYNYNDPALNPSNKDYQWMHDMIGTYAAWGVTTGNPDIKVAVVDTGVRADHEDFHRDGESDIDKRILGPVDLRSVIPDDDKDTVHVHDNDQNFEDGMNICGHGTHVAGIIAAGAGNGCGGSGIAPNVKILPVPLPMYDNTGGLPTYGIIAGINAAAGWNIDGTGPTGPPPVQIINCSLTVPFADPDLQTAVEKAAQQGVTIVAAMGNNYANDMNYPAGFDNVIAVSSVNENGYRSGFSTYGSWADVAAPGSNIYSTSKDGTYEYRSGTSMATPVVSGVCALYMSAFGRHVEPGTMEEVIRKSVTKTSSSDIGTGIINAAKLFSDGEATATIEIGESSDLDEYGSASAGNSVTLSAEMGPDAMITISKSESFDGVEDMVIFTTDGKDPATFNGEVTVGTKYENPFTAGSIAGDTAKAKKITIKAAVVNYLGLMGRITTLSFTYNPNLSKVSKNDEPVKTITLTGTPGPLKFFAQGDLKNDQPIVSATAKDKDGNDVDNVTFEWTSSNLKVAKVTGDPNNNYSAIIEPTGKGTATITCYALDGSKIKATIKVTVNQCVTGVNVTGQKYISKGSRATYTATVTPSNANNKKLSWAVYRRTIPVPQPLPEGSDISVSSSGVVTVGNNATEGDYLVEASSVDGGEITGAAFFTVKDSKVAGVYMTADQDLSEFNAAVLKKKTFIDKDGNNTDKLLLSSATVFNR